jgi:hemerythrin
VPKIIWDESFSVNNEEIDNQHKRWIDIINELHDALIKGKGLGTITGKSINAMIEYGESHFSYEEEQMKHFNYPGIATHTKIHSVFLNKMKRILCDNESGVTVLNREIMDELMNWLVAHILKEDIKFASFLQSSQK